MGPAFTSTAGKEAPTDFHTVEVAIADSWSTFSGGSARVTAAPFSAGAFHSETVTCLPSLAVAEDQHRAVARREQAEGVEQCEPQRGVPLHRHDIGDRAGRTLAVAATPLVGEKGPDQDRLGVGRRVVDLGDLPPDDIHPAEGLLYEVLGEVGVPAGQQARRPEKVPGPRRGELQIVRLKTARHALPLARRLHLIDAVGAPRCDRSIYFAGRTGTVRP
jgi:hypothetical protein